MDQSSMTTNELEEAVVHDLKQLLIVRRRMKELDEGVLSNMKFLKEEEQAVRMQDYQRLNAAINCCFHQLGKIYFDKREME